MFGIDVELWSVSAVTTRCSTSPDAGCEQTVSCAGRQ